MVKPRWTDEAIREAVNASRSYRGALKFLGQNYSQSPFSHLKRDVARLGLDTSHFWQPSKWDDDLVRKTVAESYSHAEVLRRMGKNDDSAGPFYHLKGKIRSLGLDTSHFTGLGWSRGKTCAPNRKPFQEVLVRQDRMKPKTDTGQLVRALLDSGMPHKCSTCDSPPSWRGTPLTLQVDHIDGDNRNHCPENLRFLCPNCHTQTPTYGSKFRGRKSDNGSLS